MTGSMAATLGTLNPFRYRGYCYDEETGWYYLQSRYYDPVVGRFINADGQINGGVLGANLFAYCENNPVMFSDPTGSEPRYEPGPRVNGERTWIKIEEEEGQYIAESTIITKNDTKFGEVITSKSYTSLTFNNSIAGERAANDFNSKLNQAMSVRDFALGTALGIATSGTSVVAGLIIGGASDAYSFATIFMDRSLDVHAGYTVTITTYISAIKGSMSRTGVSKVLDVYDSKGKLIMTERYGSY